MESKKIEIKEAVDVRDAIPGMAALAPVKGMIRLYDKDGNLVREVHNTIVQTGREFLFHRFLGSNTMETGKPIRNYATLTNDRSSDKFGYLHFGFATTPQMTTQDLDYGRVIGNDLYSGNKTYPITNVTFDQSALKVTISQSVSSANGLMKFNEIFITTVSSDGTTETETLFSRALIDPLYIGEDTVYDMSYSFYF